MQDSDTQSLSKQVGDMQDLFSNLRSTVQEELGKWKEEMQTQMETQLNEMRAEVEGKISMQGTYIKELKAQIATLKEDNDNLKARIQLEEGEIQPSLNDELNQIKEEMKTLRAQEEKIVNETTTWAQVIKETQQQVEDVGNWIEVAKQQRNVPSTPNIINDTLEEEKRRKIRALHVRVVGWKEERSPQEDAKALCTKMGINDTPFVSTWRVGKNTTRDRALILNFEHMEKRKAFLANRRALKGEKVYLEDDLTPAQVAHRRECMPRIMEARQAGKWAVYRDGRVIITEKRAK